jgi:hypothetical protein
MEKIRIWDGKNLDPGWKKYGSGTKRIRNTANNSRGLSPVLQIRTELREVAASDQEASDLSHEDSNSQPAEEKLPEEKEKTKTKEKIFEKTTGKLLSGTGKFQVQKPGKR